MLTTVVGSYPVITQEPKSFTGKIKASFGNYDPYKSAIKQAVVDQIEAGVDLISDGQVRGSMLEIFAKSIPGMSLENKKPVIHGKITPASYCIGASDIELALKTAKKISPDYGKKTEILKEQRFNQNFKGVKGIVTGPTTLVLSSLIEGFYNKDKKEKAIVDLAWALKKEVEFLEDTGVALIQIDEPYLSTGIADLQIARKAVDIITGNMGLPVAMHVCGDVTGIWDELLKFKIDIIDCEFAGQPENLHILENTDLNGKKLGMGCIDSKTDKIESKDQVASILKIAIKNLGEDNIMADPDCGMRLRSREAAFSKLKVMVDTVKWLS